MPIIKANGIPYYYELHGRGRPLVLIAGYTGSHTFWRFMQNQLASTFQVLVFDNRAIGQTKDGGGSFTLEMMADDTMALVDALGLVQPHILGQSMGGCIAQILAKKHPQKLDKLIILNSFSQLNVRTQKTLEALLNLRKANTEFNLFIDAAMPWFFSKDYLLEPENIRAFKEDLINDPFPQSVADQERQCYALLPFDSREWIPQISSPTLVISAEEDIIVLPQESMALAKGIPQAQFLMVPGAHSSPVEQYDLLSRKVKEFLNS